MCPFCLSRTARSAPRSEYRRFGPDQTSSRLILNLIDAKTQNLIRSEKLDYSKDQNLIIQDEVISVMVNMLGLELEAGIKDLITMGGSRLNEANELD